MSAPSNRSTTRADERWRKAMGMGLVVLAAVFLWAYWPTFVDLASIWSREPDYSHGFLVVPFAIGLLWLRRDELHSIARQFSPWGLLWILASVLVRYIGVRYSFDSLDGYSLILWVAGVVHLWGGRQLLSWAGPSIAFLFFMVPLPFQVERLLSVPLQRVATAFSCFLLQCLGQPAFAEGTTILVGTHQLAVEQTCSGLRIFLGAFALAFAYVMATRRELWEKVVLLASVIPIALLANSLRIVITALLYRYSAQEELIQRFNHDAAGWLMIAMATGMFAVVLAYLSRLFPRVEVMGMGELIDRSRSEI